MLRQLVSPLASALVMPGLGQIINRQPGKGAFLIMGASLMFMAGLFMTSYKISQAMMAMGEITPETDKWAALRDQLAAQGSLWLWLIGGLFLALWGYAVIDAWRTGRRLDAEARALKLAEKQDNA